MSDDPRSRHVHDDSCWREVSVCTASDLPQHVCDDSCVEVQNACGYRGLY